MQIVLAFIAFNFIIIIHELGHFTVAKLSGIKVQEFSLFFGPKLLQIKKGETLYTLRLLPILAYVKMEGEEEESKSEKSYNKKPARIRAAVIAAGPLANLVAAIIILTVIFSVGGYSTTKIDLVQDKSAASDIGIQKGDKIIKYDGKSVYQPTDLITFLYVSKGKPSQVEVSRGGSTFTRTIIPEKVPASESYKLGFTAKEASGPDSNVVADITHGYPAGKVGLLKGDRIVKLGSEKVSSKQDIADFLTSNKGNPFDLYVIRNGKTIDLGKLTPKIEKTQDEYLIGIDFAYEKHGIIASLGNSLVFTYSNVRNECYTLYWLITRKVHFNQIMGPIGIFSTISGVVQQSPTIYMLVMNLLYITSMLSIAIGAFNLIPFPALDGNKLLLLAIEGIRKRPLSIEKEAMITMIGFVALISLAVFTFYNDILRIITGG